jgi:broad specificity phosphatase PhoE
VTRLFLIRHGVTEWNKQGRYCGHRDVGLSGEGRAQAARLGKKLKTVKFDRIYCSDRKRALQTSRIIFKGAGFITVKELREIDFGALEGLRHSQIKGKCGDIYESWLEDPYKNNIPKTEPMSNFKKRVKSAVDKIVHLNSDKTVAIVCHGGVIGAFVDGILKTGKFWRCVPSAASITVVACGAERRRLEKFNDTAHLR